MQCYPNKLIYIKAFSNSRFFKVWYFAFSFILVTWGWTKDVKTTSYFPHKSCLLAMGQHCTDNFLVQCCPRYIFRQNYRLFSCGNLFVDCDLALRRQFSCPMLVKTDQEKTLCLFSCKKMTVCFGPRLQK